MQCLPSLAGPKVRVCVQRLKKQTRIATQRFSNVGTSQPYNRKLTDIAGTRYRVHGRYPIPNPEYKRFSENKGSRKRRK